MYKEPHLQKKSDECAALWYEWESLWRSNKLGTKEARKVWCNCCDELSRLLEEEVKTNPRYIEFKEKYKHLK